MSPVVSQPEAREPDAAAGRQPYLNDAVTCLGAARAVLSGPDGQVRGGVHGLLADDVRWLCEAVLTFDGREPVPIGHTRSGPGQAEFVGVLPWLGGGGADPGVRVHRRRVVDGGGWREEVEVVNDSHLSVTFRVELRLGADLAPLQAVKAGSASRPLSPGAVGGQRIEWESRAGQVSATVDGDLQPVSQGETVLVQGSWLLPARSSRSAALGITHRSPPGERLQAAALARPLSSVEVHSADRDVTRLLSVSLGDLDALVMAETPAAGPSSAGAPAPFLAAGSPWYFTLFGRDSLWAARMLVPVSTELAAGTLRALAARQGRRADPRNAEAPGKILHEVRLGPPVSVVPGHDLPAVYYGTVDATPLWVLLLHDAWRWGLDVAQVRALLPAARSALGWLLDHGDEDGDGFYEYVDRAGTGLANQGWKDSGDAVQHPDGRVADPPIALCEAQAYAYQALLAGAELLSWAGLPGDEALVSRCRERAGALAEAFRERFWVSDADGPFPALALDGHKQPVASPSSNLGHLLGTGLLNAAEEAVVAERLAGEALGGGRGLRTLPADHVSFNPLGYHTGSIWPHDTAIAVRGLAQAGHPREAAQLATGLLEAAAPFDHRLPELFAGTGREAPLLPYPASCRPQAWAAAASVSLLVTAIGLTADLPRGSLHVAPSAPFAEWFPVGVSGLRLGAHDLSVDVERDGACRVVTSADVRVVT